MLGDIFYTWNEHQQGILVVVLLWLIFVGILFGFYSDSVLEQSK